MKKIDKLDNFILVTGAGGYLGRHLIPALYAEGARIAALDCRPVEFPKLNVECRIANVTRPDEIRAAFKGVDTLVHLACLPVGRSFQFPVEDFEVNALGTFYVLSAAKEAGVRKVVYTSTSEVYGAPSATPVDESHPISPASPYAASKHSGELTCRVMHKCFGLDTVVLRLFNIYGLAADGGDRPTVESIFIREVLAGRPPVVTAPPGTAKDFVHVSDVIRAITMAVKSPGAAGEIINIGTGIATSLVDLARMVIRKAGARMEPETRDSTSPPVILQADIRKAGRLLGYQPRVNLEDGLGEIFEFYRKRSR